MNNFLRYHWPVLFFLSAAILATVFSVDYQQSIRAQLSLALGLLCYVAVIIFTNTPSRFYSVLFAAAFSIFLATLFILSDEIMSQPDNPLLQIYKLSNALFVVPNDVLILAVMAPLMLGLAWTGDWRIRGLTIFYLVVALIIGVNLQSRQTVFLLLLGPVIVIALMRPRLAAPALFIGIVVGIISDGLSGWTLAHKIFLFPRTYVWHTAWVMFLDQPLTGQGPGLFKDLYFTFLGKAGYVIQELSDRRTMPWAHNLYLEQLAERGVFGFFALLGLLGAAMYRAAKFWRHAGSDLTRSLASGVLAALIVLAISGIAEATLSRLWVAISLLILSALSTVAVRMLHQGVMKDTYQV